jgi:hypothetical protein
MRRLLGRLFEAHPTLVPARLWCAVVCGGDDGVVYTCSRCA